MRARQLPMQENLRLRIADYILQETGIAGKASAVEAQHICSNDAWSGVTEFGASASVRLGVFREFSGMRAEFLQLIGKK
ncbi:hypothetical protein A8C75_19480 [Marinobacterium aestuarii]|uniref:Uncharacterized protein n=1 Tax=Marinobacterium aestuarii TaxID=1821621 RepID=A0A1A9F2L3_9GAMM|nr:GTP cyclohydrolase I [Marinobacterium aestuarii]ANG64437.1 hypothetical protein A8C75_19480 [Marinobacterium aestuarii]